MTLINKMLEREEELYELYNENLVDTLANEDKPYFKAICMTLETFSKKEGFGGWGGDEYLLLQEIIFKYDAVMIDELRKKTNEQI